MLPPDLGHCLLALRLEALGQFIADPVDRQDLIVDGTLGHSRLFSLLRERIDKRRELPLETILLEIDCAELLLWDLALGRG